MRTERLAGTPGRLRSFDPARVADLEFRVWVGYYLRDWPGVLRASIGLVRAGFGMDWVRTLHGAWLVLRANQLWAPEDNDPDGARRCMRRFYGLLKISYGQPGDVAEAARLEVDWWRVHHVSDCLYWAVGASPLAARCHVMGPSLSPSRLGDLTGHYGGPRGRPAPRRVIRAAGSAPGARTTPGPRITLGPGTVAKKKRPEAQGGRTSWLLRLAIMRALLNVAGRPPLFN